MGIIKYISTFVLCEQTWKSIYLTLTQLRRPPNTSLRDKSKAQIPSSWTLNAQCAITSRPSTPTHRRSSFALTASTFSAYQRVEKESFALDPPGEERATEPTRC